jgi:hypothetical protein
METQKAVLSTVVVQGKQKNIEELISKLEYYHGLLANNEDKATHYIHKEQQAPHISNRRITVNTMSCFLR